MAMYEPFFLLNPSLSYYVFSTDYATPQNLEEDGTYDARYPVAIPFAAHLLPSKEDQEAALSYLGGIQATAWMVEFIKAMMAGEFATSSLFLKHSI